MNNNNNQKADWIWPACQDSQPLIWSSALQPPHAQESLRDPPNSAALVQDVWNRL